MSGEMNRLSRQAARLLIKAAKAAGLSLQETAAHIMALAEQLTSDKLEGVSLRTMQALTLCAGSTSTMNSKPKMLVYLRTHDLEDQALRRKLRTQAYRRRHATLLRNLGAHAGETTDETINNIITRYRYYRNLLGV